MRGGSERNRLNFKKFVRCFKIIVCSLLGEWPVSRKSRNLFGPEELFYVFRVCIQGQSFNNFENDTMKLSVNEARLTGL